MSRAKIVTTTLLFLASALAGASLLGADESPVAPPAATGTHATAATQPAAPLSAPRNRASGMRARPFRPNRDALIDRAMPDATPGTNDPFPDAEQIDRLMKFMETNFRGMYDRLVRLRERDPVTFQKMIRRVGRQMFPILRADADNPELAKRLIAEHRAQLRLQELKENYLRTRDSAEQQRLRAEIRLQMDRAFDLRMERLRVEVKQLQRKLDKAKDHLSEQEKNKQRLIDERLTNFLQQGSQRP